MKRKISVILLLLSVFMFAGCVRKGVYDISVFEQALKKTNGQLTLDYDNCFADDDVFYFFWSFNNENDVALRLPVDPNGAVAAITVSMLNNEIMTPYELFMQICRTAVFEFFPAEEQDAAFEETGVFREELYFGDNTMYSYKGEKYDAVFLVTGEAVSFSVLPSDKNNVKTAG